MMKPVVGPTGLQLQSDNPEVSVGVIFREAGKIVERTVAEGSIRFFSDGGTDAPY